MLVTPNHTFREIDAACGLAKGTAFRAFKSVEPTLHQGKDFVLLHHHRDAARIQTLRQENRIYRASVNVVLLSDHGRDKVVAALLQD